MWLKLANGSLSSLVLLLCVLSAASPSAQAMDVRLQLEGGAVVEGRNEARIPGTTGTLIDLGQGKRAVQPHARLEAFLGLAPRHRLRAVVAPLQVESSQVFDGPVTFDGVSFAAGSVTETLYRFNSYRLSYAYRLYQGDWGDFDVGLTLKVRQARISLQQASLYREFNDLGFVPLFYFAYQKDLGGGWSLYSDLDAAAAPQGRAFDFAFKVRREIADNWQLGVGYRTLEGGADNDKVFTFSWFHYGVVDLVAQF